jgi:PKD repeat protein
MKNVYPRVLKLHACAVVAFCILFSSSVIANTNLVASFTVNGTQKCLASNQFEFTNTSTNLEGNTYAWDFGDGTNSTLANTTKTYTLAGNYRVRLEVRNGTSYAFTELFIDVLPTPEVDFVTLTNTLNGNSFTFISSSKIKSGNMNYSWDFGDTTFSTLINPTKTYANPGLYNVKLVVTSDFGCKDSITKSINYNYTPPTPPAPPVNNPPTPPTPVTCATPVAAFAVNTEKQCKKGNEFIFTNNSTASNGTLSYVWNFDDGTTSTTENATKTFTEQGVYNVQLTVTNNIAGGCSTTVNKTVTVYGVNAAFTINPTTLQCFKGNNFVFTNSSNTNGSGLSYAWSYNGTNSATTEPTTSYTTPGNYTVTLVATGTELGCKDTLTKPITVYPSPTANFTVNAANQCLSNNNFQFTNASTISGSAVNYEWYFGNGNSAVTTNANQQYAANGAYTVTLIASSEFGCRDTISKIVNVSRTQAAFTINNTRLQCFAGNNFTFTNSSNSSVGGLAYTWDLAEGTTSTATNPTKQYSAPGTYTVTLIASAGSNCADTLSKTLTVYPMPNVAFTTNEISSNPNTINIQMNNSSSISSGSNNYQWFFGDNTSSISVNPTHVFVKNVASRIVKLVAVSNHGCRDSLMREVSMLDGSSTPTTPQSATTATNNASSEVANISVYPNPVANNANVNVITNINANITVRLMDHLGRVITTTQRNTIANTNNNVNFNMSGMPTGIYFVDAVSITGARMGIFTISKN